jgi:hypothetical protein
MATLNTREKTIGGSGPEPSHDETARQAYELFEQRGREHGRDWEDWFRAERELRDRQRTWSLEARKESLVDDPELSTLLLRLGIAVNATRAAQRFFYAVKDTRGPGGERDRFWAFLIGVGFMREAIQTLLRPKFPQIKALAMAGGADGELIEKVGALLSGKLPLSKTLNRLRNKLIFHWDETPIREFVQRYTEDRVVWADGIGNSQGEMIYRAAADALSNSVLPDDSSAPQPEPPEESMARLQRLLGELFRATELVLRMFDFAIKGHLLRVDVKTVWSEGAQSLDEPSARRYES